VHTKPADRSFSHWACLLHGSCSNSTCNAIRCTRLKVQLSSLHLQYIHQLCLLASLQYILRTDNLEKVPNTAACRAGTAAAACGPGFFDAARPASPAGGSMPLIFRGLSAAHLKTSSSLAGRLLHDGLQGQAGAWLQTTVEPAPQVLLHACTDDLVVCCDMHLAPKSAIWHPGWSTAYCTLQEPHPCCDGYFCPPALTCMMPCPLGAYCRR
jgi:hypothetical protein